MRESQIKVAIRLIKMQLQGGSITQSEYDTRLAELTIISSESNCNIKTEKSIDTMCHPELVEGHCVSVTNAQTIPINQSAPNPQSTTIATIDAEKSRLSNLLHTIPSHKSAKHITDQIIALRKKRKDAYTTERHQRPSTDGMHAVSNENTIANTKPTTQAIQPTGKPLYRQMENLRINIGRWEKSLAKLISSGTDGIHAVSVSDQIATLTKKINDGKIKHKSLGA